MGTTYDEYSLISFGGLQSSSGKTSKKTMFFKWVFLFQLGGKITTYTLSGECLEIG
jgi:hypothetical protein